MPHAVPRGNDSNCQHDTERDELGRDSLEGAEALRDGVCWGDSVSLRVHVVALRQELHTGLVLLL